MLLADGGWWLVDGVRADLHRWLAAPGHIARLASRRIGSPLGHGGIVFGFGPRNLSVASGDRGFVGGFVRGVAGVLGLRGRDLFGVEPGALLFGGFGWSRNCRDRASRRHRRASMFAFTVGIGRCGRER